MRSAARGSEERGSYLSGIVKPQSSIIFPQSWRDVAVPAAHTEGGGGGRTETNLGHDRSTGGRGIARLQRLRRLGRSLAEGLGGHNYGGLLWSHHSHGRCQRGLLEEERRDGEINRM